MRIISSVMGTAAIRVFVDDVLPKRVPLQRDLVAVLSNAYSFNIAPAIGQGRPPQPVLNFKSGEFLSMDGKIPIQGLTMYPDGNAVAAQDTDLADIVLSDFLARLDSEFAYRFGEINPKRLYASAIVSEFSERFSEHAETISAISGVVNDILDPEARSYRLRQLSFGNETVVPPGSVLSAILLGFSIERRAQEPMARNRFFSVAPLTTDAHSRLLQRIESVVS